MTSYKVKYSKDSVKFMKNNKKVGLKFFAAFSEIAENNLNVNLYDVKNLKGYDSMKRLRIGKYRAIFEIMCFATFFSSTVALLKSTTIFS
ncbi:MAG: type II toxin-antitoxin system RelE family toxin [Cetobacterium sp.]